MQQAQQQQQPPDQPPEEPVAKKPRGYSDRRIRELSQDLTAHVESVGSPGRQGLVVKGFLERVDPRVLQAAGATLPSHAEASAIIVANLAGNLALNAPQPGNQSVVRKTAYDAALQAAVTGAAGAPGKPPPATVMASVLGVPVMQVRQAAARGSALVAAAHAAAAAAAVAAVPLAEADAAAANGVPAPDPAATTAAVAAAAAAAVPPDAVAAAPPPPPRRAVPVAFGQPPPRAASSRTVTQEEAADMVQVWESISSPSPQRRDQRK